VGVLNWVVGVLNWVMGVLNKSLNKMCVRLASKFKKSTFQPIPLTALSKAWVCGGSLAGIAASNSAGSMGVSCEWFFCCRVEVSVTGRSLVRRSPTECGVWSSATKALHLQCT
jgi:hypothetical protein